MTQILQALLEYTWSRRFPRYLNQTALDQLKELEAGSLDCLRQGLSSAQLEALEKYQDACRYQQELEQEAMFLAALSVARELP